MATHFLSTSDVKETNVLKRTFLLVSQPPTFHPAPSTFYLVAPCLLCAGVYITGACGGVTLPADKTAPFARPLEHSLQGSTGSCHIGIACTFQPNLTFFQVTLPNPRTLAHKSSFIPRTSQLWKTLPSSAFFETYNLSSSKSNIKNLSIHLTFLRFPSFSFVEALL